MKRIWIFIISSNLELTEKIDLIIVKLIKARALIVLFIDKEDIIRGFQDKIIFY
jgi:hypothetical protein